MRTESEDCHSEDFEKLGHAQRVVLRLDSMQKDTYYDRHRPTSARNAYTLDCDKETLRTIDW